MIIHFIDPGHADRVDGEGQMDDDLPYYFVMFRNFLNIHENLWQMTR